MRRLYKRIYRHFLILLAAVGIATTAVLAGGWRLVLHDQAARLARHVAGLLEPVAHDRGALSRRTLEIARSLDIDVTLKDGTGGVIVADVQDSWRPPRAHAELRDATGRVLGTVTVSAQRTMRARSLLRPVALVLMILTGVGLGIRPLARRIARPLERITDASRRFGAGDLDTRVTVGHGPHGQRCPRHHDELHELAHAWNDMAERIERLVRGQKELLANVSHELRSPLARIRVAMELTPKQGYLEDVERDLGELERLIEDVLATSRLDLGGLPARRERLDVVPLLSDLAERARHDPLTRDQPIRIDGPASLELDADPVLIRRALWNLLENAAKYGAPPIVLAARREGACVVLVVTDEGEGIPDGERKRVLEPFYRVDKARTPAGPGQPPPGFGLGLTFAKKVAEVHGGSLELAGANPRGLRVTLRLPATFT
jgi:signal transduction histidine kinase